MIKKLSLIAAAMGAFAAAQFSFSGPVPAPDQVANRFAASDVPALDFGGSADRWVLPKS